jgi:serine/threonine protein kinase
LGYHGEWSVNTQLALIGTRLAAYDIQAVLGSGGMATVYRAFDTNLHRVVAIKVLSPAAAAQPGFAERFRQEARLIASLRHPNIVQVYDFGDQDGHTYMVQELLAGPTLGVWMADLAARDMRPTAEDISTIVGQLAGALDAAHAAGIIHRDVKPANVLWHDPGRLVLTDFGIAKHVLSNVNQTRFGVVFGTPSYLSPEQAQSLPLTPASDVYSLGVVLYELLPAMCHFVASPRCGWRWITFRHRRRRCLPDPICLRPSRRWRCAHWRKIRPRDSAVQASSRRRWPARGSCLPLRRGDRAPTSTIRRRSTGSQWHQQVLRSPHRRFPARRESTMRWRSARRRIDHPNHSRRSHGRAHSSRSLARCW